MPVTINGTNGITFNNSSTQAQSAGLGSSATAQTWQDVTASRVNNTTYTNSTGYPIMVAVSTGQTGSAFINFRVNGLLITQQAVTSGAGGAQTTVIVPNGATYLSDSNAINTWLELR
jgi:hypothetical protein